MVGRRKPLIDNLKRSFLGEYEDEESGTTNNYSSSYSNDADVSSSCDEEEDGSFYSTRSWGSYGVFLS